MPSSGSTHASGTVGSLAVASHADYVFAYTGDPVFALPGSAVLKWSLTRKDGANVAVPTTATVKVYDTTGALIATIAPDVESGVAAATQVLAALWTLPAVGAFSTELTVTIGTEPQIRSDLEIVGVR